MVETLKEVPPSQSSRIKWKRRQTKRR